MNGRSLRVGTEALIQTSTATAVDVLDAVTVLVVTVAAVEIDDAKVIGTTTRCATPAPHSISR